MLIKLSRRLFVTATILAMFAGSPVHGEECGTVIPPGQLEQELARMAQGWQPPPAGELGQWYVLPITVHIVRHDDGTGGLTMTQLDSAMDQLNLAYEPAEISFIVCGQVIYIDDDDYYNLPYNSAWHDALRSIAPIPTTINVWFTYLDDLGGLSSYTFSPVQGILMNNLHATNGSTFAHEVGHYFDLYHTHEDFGGLYVECPDSSNSDAAGDFITDTPADPNVYTHVSAHPDCVYDDYASIPAHCNPLIPYHPPVENLMSYAPPLCRDSFTVLQCEKVRYILTTAPRKDELLTYCKWDYCGSPNNQGDVDDDGLKYAVSDMITLLRYITQDPPTTISDLCSAELDGFYNPYFPCEPTIGDLVAFKRWFCYGGDAIGNDCDNMAPPLIKPSVTVEFPAAYKAVSSDGFVYQLFYIKNTSSQPVDIFSITVPIYYEYNHSDVFAMVAQVEDMQDYGVWDNLNVVISPDSAVAVFYAKDCTSSKTLDAGERLFLFRIKLQYVGVNPPVTFTPKVFTRSPAWVPVMSSSPNYTLAMGEPLDVNPSQFLWEASPVCCADMRGNANGDPDDKVNISDVTYLIDYLFGIPTGPEPVCWEEANANGDIDEKVNVSDVSYLITYLFGVPSGPAPPACP